MVVPQFTKTGAVEGDTFNALDVIQFKGLVAGTRLNPDATAASIQVHQPSDDGYKKYYYVNDAMKIVESKPQQVTGWTDAALLSENIAVKKFHGFWLRIINCEDGATMTVAGEVRDLSKPVVVPVGEEGFWQIISNPFPCDLNIDNIAVDGLTPGTRLNPDATAPSIQVHNPVDDGYHKYYYVNDAMKIVEGKPTQVTGWTDAALLSTGKICDAGKGFWFKVISGSGTLTFTMPTAE